MGLSSILRGIVHLDHAGYGMIIILFLYDFKSLMFHAEGCVAANLQNHAAASYGDTIPRLRLGVYASLRRNPYMPWTESDTMDFPGLRHRLAQWLESPCDKIWKL